MNPRETALLEKTFPDIADQEKAIWYVRAAKCVVASGLHPTKDRIWDYYCHSAVAYGVQGVLEPHKHGPYIEFLKRLGLVEEASQ